MAEEVTPRDPCFSFGKYKGLPISEVIKVNPSYVRWCVRNVEWFKLPEGIVLPPVRRRIIWMEDDDYWGSECTEFDW